MRRPVSGTPQGGVISPLLCNVYLHRLDRAWRPALRGAGPLRRRSAGDVPVHGAGRGRAGEADLLLAELGLEPKPDKTRIVQLAVGGEGFDFLGFHHRLVRSRPRRRHRRLHLSGPLALAQAVQHARDRIRFTDDAGPAGRTGRTGRGGSQPLPPRLGRVFRFGNSARVFDKIRKLRPDAAGAVHRQTAPARPRLGLRAGLPIARQLGLVSLNGIVVAPRPNRAWRVRPNTAGEGRR